jgi:hypothetical protein
LAVLEARIQDTFNGARNVRNLNVCGLSGGHALAVDAVERLQKVSRVEATLQVERVLAHLVKGDGFATSSGVSN